MRTRACVAIGVAAAAFVLPARADEERAFSNLHFGDSRGLVARRIRENLDEGLFRRDCYKCPVRVAIGRYGLDLTPKFSAGQLWQVSLRYAMPRDGSKESEALKKPWSLFRKVIATRYPQPQTVSKGFPDLPAPAQVKAGVNVVTDTWVEESKRLDLAVTATVEQGEIQRSLRESWLSRWFSGGDPRDEKRVTYAVEIRITSTAMEAPSEHRGDRPVTDPEEIERASDLF